jgi:hypothetical protein
MRYWLFKSEPSTWSWDQQVARGDAGEEWDGVRNYQARNFMREMALGDLGFFYHSQSEKAVVGIVEVIAKAHPDSTTDDDRWECVDIKAVEAMPRPVTLDADQGAGGAGRDGPGEELAPVGAAGHTGGMADRPGDGRSLVGHAGSPPRGGLRRSRAARTVRRGRTSVVVSGVDALFAEMLDEHVVDDGAVLVALRLAVGLDHAVDGGCRDRGCRRGRASSSGSSSSPSRSRPAGLPRRSRRRRHRSRGRIRSSPSSEGPCPVPCRTCCAGPRRIARSARHVCPSFHYLPFI